MLILSKFTSQNPFKKTEKECSHNPWQINTHIFLEKRNSIFVFCLSFVSTDTLVYHNIYGNYMRIILTGDGLPLV